MLTRNQCRVAMHNAERIARCVEEGNRFALATLDSHIAEAEAAYLAPACETVVAQRIHVALDRMMAVAA